MDVARNETDLLFPANLSLLAAARRLEASLDGGREVEGLLEEREGLALYVLARRAAQLGNVVEIGSYKGRSTWYLARALLDAGSPHRVIAIDPHLEGTLADFDANVARTGIGAHVDQRLAYSTDVATRFDEPIGLLWIDGDHSYEAVAADFKAWFPLLAEGGWVAFHDTANHWYGPTRLVRELLARRDDLRSVGLIGTIAFARKAPPRATNRVGALAGRAAFELTTLLRARSVGHGPRNQTPEEARTRALAASPRPWR